MPTTPATVAVGQTAAQALDVLVVVDGGPGGRAAGIVDGALAAGLPADQVIAVNDAAAAVDAVLAIAGDGDVVLVKASRGIELEHVVDGLVARLGDPEPAQ